MLISAKCVARIRARKNTDGSALAKQWLVAGIGVDKMHAILYEFRSREQIDEADFSRLTGIASRDLKMYESSRALFSDASDVLSLNIVLGLAFDDITRPYLGTSADEELLRQMRDNYRRTLKGWSRK